jgi:hypothetical protein
MKRGVLDGLTRARRRCVEYRDEGKEDESRNECKGGGSSSLRGESEDRKVGKVHWWEHLPTEDMRPYATASVARRKYERHEDEYTSEVNVFLISCYLLCSSHHSLRSLRRI